MCLHKEKSPEKTLKRMVQMYQVQAKHLIQALHVKHNYRELIIADIMKLKKATHREYTSSSFKKTPNQHVSIM